MSLPDRAALVLKRIAVRNYKSIRQADVRLGSFTILVGRNGSGKSNFLDALRFVADGLQTSLDHAISTRNGVREILYREAESPHFSITLELELPKNQVATYGITVNAREEGSSRLDTELLRVRSEAGSDIGHYHVENGRVVESSIKHPPPIRPDRLYLGNASGYPEFRPVYDVLGSMSFYNLDPDAMRVLQEPSSGELLRRAGGNVASVVARLDAKKPRVLERITQYISHIFPGLQSIERIALGPFETIQFKQKLPGSGDRLRRFFPWSMSDGTLRAMGSLLAASQFAGHGSRISLVGIEEPETALHPAAAGVLMDALREAATHTQILITSHSPDLLDQADLSTDQILAVIAEEGETKIAPLDDVSLRVIQDHLFTPGELLRLDQLEPDRGDLARQAAGLSGAHEERTEEA